MHPVAAAALAAVLVAVSTIAPPQLALAQPPPAQAAVVPPIAPVPPLAPPFAEWLAALRAEAAGRGIRPEILDQAFSNVPEPLSQILERDRSQAEFTLDLATYLKRRLTRETVKTAQTMYSRHRALLHRVSEKYGVDPRILIAVWGLESNFGRFSGVRPTIAALITLAYDTRRAAMFRAELFNALEIVNRGDIDFSQLKGSWAGALGQPQFMPSSYLEYAQDFDGDGRRDIWSTEADVFASVAYYLQRHGWTAADSWGREVRVPPAVRAKLLALPRRETGCVAERIMTPPRPLSAWRALGLRPLANGTLPESKTPASLVQAGTRTFLLYANYDALLAYNCAHTYALSVGLLAERLR
ncbi:MAG: lytic murein transglycosylase [Acidobacteriota bacterium]